MVELSLQALEQAWESDGRAAEFVVWRTFLPGSPETLSYETAAVRTGRTPAAVKTVVHRLRLEFRARLRAAVARTVSRPDEVDDELRYLRQVLSEDLPDSLKLPAPPPQEPA